MLIDLYMDIYEGAEPKYLMAMATVSKKTEGYRRFRISVNVPDAALFGEIDGSLPVQDMVEVDK